MPVLDLRKLAYKTAVHGGNTHIVLDKDVLSQFDPSVLGLGDIATRSSTTSSLVAIFDLGGFTHFCGQIDPDLSIPVFMNDYLTWLFDSIRKETFHTELPEGTGLWHPLPYSVKFLGDGLLILWDISHVEELYQHNLIVSLRLICQKYATEFLEPERKRVADPPYQLRCGAAKGTVYSIGDGRDYVGSCINLASRLQKLDGITFAFARRGFNPENYWQGRMQEWHLASLGIRGLNNPELVYIAQSEFEKLSPETQKQYPAP